MRKKMIVPWFGPRPDWLPRYLDNLETAMGSSFDWHFFYDLDEFKQRVRSILGIDCPIEPGSGKIHDYRPAFGALFADVLKGYDFWGHTDMDCVYGRLEHFYDDERLAQLDVFSDHTHYLCGPWTLYRNTPEVAWLFDRHPQSSDILENPTPTGWVETGFTEVIDASGLRIVYDLRHAWQQPELLSRDGGSLFHDGREVPFFHFRYTKQWPGVLA